MNGRVTKRIIVFLSSFGFAGHVPLLAGTIAAIEGALISLIFNFHPWLKGLVFIIFFIPGIYISDLAEKRSGIKDDHNIVIDEVTGAIAATFFLPDSLWPWLVTLIAFRFFDWLKPFPIRRAEALPRGVGIVVDDVIAGIYSMGFTWIVYNLLQ